MRITHLKWLVAALASALAAAAVAQDTDPIAEYRAMFGDDNPAVFWEMRGEEQWKTKRGPKNADLSACDLGLGKGVVAGAYAQLPRYFKDADRVQDLESRIVWCAQTLQGIAPSELLKIRFGNGDAERSDVEALSAYAVSLSKGEKMAVPFAHPAEKAAYETGRALFYYRAGPHDFSCSTCHAASGKRIRLQALPNLTDPADVRTAYTSWPAYRISQGELRTMEWRLNDCFRQQRLPDLQYGSDAAIALTMFLAKNADGGVLTAPALKR